MQFYFEHGDSSSEERQFLLYDPSLEEEVPGNSGYIFAPADTSSNTYEFAANREPGYVLIDGSFEITLRFAKSGELRIIPSLHYRGDPSEPDTLLWAGQPLSTLEHSKRMVWGDDLIANLDLGEKNLVLKLDVSNDSGTSNSSMTFDASSGLVGPVGKGARHRGTLYTEVVYALFQKRRRGVIVSEIPTFKKTSGNFIVEVKPTRNVTSSLYTEVVGLLPVSGTIDTEVITTPLSSLTGPVLSDVTIDGAALQGPELLEQITIKDALDSLYYPDPLIPPAPISEPDYANENIFSYVAEIYYSISEELRLARDRFGFSIPGQFLQPFTPSSLYSGEYLFREGEWQLPRDYSDRFYSIVYPISPSVTVGGQNRALSSASGVWFSMRHRTVGAELSASLGSAQGNLVLKKEINPEEEFWVWFWESPAPPFDITLLARNHIGQRPGFAGRYACAAVCI